MIVTLYIEPVLYGMNNNTWYKLFVTFLKTENKKKFEHQEYLYSMVLTRRIVFGGFPSSSFCKESACNAEGPGSPVEGIGYPLQYSVGSW